MTRAADEMSSTKGEMMDWNEAVVVLDDMKRRLEDNLKSVKTAELTIDMKSKWKQQIEALKMGIDQLQITIDNQ